LSVVGEKFYAATVDVSFPRKERFFHEFRVQPMLLISTDYLNGVWHLHNLLILLSNRKGLFIWCCKSWQIIIIEGIEFR
jgi:hypothetical protein